jgi:hypothetical protein
VAAPRGFHFPQGLTSIKMATAGTVHRGLAPSSRTATEKEVVQFWNSSLGVAAGARCFSAGLREPPRSVVLDRDLPEFNWWRLPRIRYFRVGRTDERSVRSNWARPWPHPPAPHPHGWGRRSKIRGPDSLFVRSAIGTVSALAALHAQAETIKPRSRSFSSTLDQQCLVWRESEQYGGG